MYLNMNSIAIANKKNIAIFLPGRIKTSQIELVINNLKQFTKQYNVFFFISVNKSANDDNYNKQFFNKLNNAHVNMYLNIEDTKEPDELHKFPKKSETSYERCYSMFYHNKRCFELLEKFQKRSNVKFHAIVKYRGDISSPKLMDISDTPLDDTIYIPDGADWGGINDQIAYGTSEAMRKYCNCVDSILEYCADGVIFHPETLLRHHIIKINLKIQRYQYDYKISK